MLGWLVWAWALVAAGAGAAGGARGAGWCPAGCSCSRLDMDAVCRGAGGRFTVGTDQNNWLTVACMDGDLSCEEMPQFSHGKNASISLKLKECSVGVLPCLRARLGAARVRELYLDSPQGGATLTARHLDGMDLELLFVVDNSGEPIPFPSEALATQPNLKEVDFNTANLTLHSGAFDSLQQLTALDLTNTNIGHVPPGLFTPLKRLKALHLFGNQIEVFPEGSFDGLTSLEELGVESNKLSNLSFILPLTALTRLSAIGNRIQTLPQLGQLASLEEVQLGNNGVALQLGGGALRGAGRLRALGLRGARVAVLEGGALAGAAALRQLDLADNGLEALPPGLFHDQHELTELHLENNKLKKLEAGVFNGLTALTTLTLDYNQLEELSADVFSGLQSLQYLSVTHNALRDISFMAFTPMKHSLTTLALDYNLLGLESDTPSLVYDGLEDSSGSWITELQALRTLSLSHNRLLRALGTGTGGPLTLVSLDLSHNDIEQLAQHEVEFLSENVTVDFRHNKILALYLGPATEPPGESRRASTALLDDNPLACDCRLYQLARRLRGYASITAEAAFDVGDARCQDPPALRGRLVRTLDLRDLACEIPRKDGCAKDCNCTFTPETNAIRLDCLAVPQLYPPNFDKSFYELRLRSAPSFLSLGISNLRSVDLSGLHMETIPFDEVPESVEMLDLSGNNLTEIPVRLLKTDTKLRLRGNPFVCDCWSKDDVSKLQESRFRVEDWSNVTCSGDVVMQNVNPWQLCATWLAAAVGTALGLLGLLVAVAAALLYIYMLEVKVWLYSRGLCSWFVCEEELDKNKKYDAFVSFCHKDEQFVMQNFLPGLEAGPFAYKICVHYRDWVPGEWIPAQIASSVDASRRTIVVVSKNFLDSMWGRLEFRAANMHAIKERRARAIVVLLEDISSHRELDPELKAYLSTNTYLKWGDPWFWDKLRYAMPHKGPVRDRKAARKAAAKAKKKGQELAKHLNGALNTQLTANGKIINAARDCRAECEVRPDDACLRAPQPGMEVALHKPTKESYGPMDGKFKSPQFDIPNLPKEVILNVASKDFSVNSDLKDNNIPKYLEDVIPRGRKVV